MSDLTTPHAPNGDPSAAPSNTSTDEQTTQPAPIASSGAAWFAGAIGAAVALGIGEVADRFSESLTSLVIGVGNLFVQLTPGDVVATSINTIGALQKPLLISGIILGSIAVGGWLAIRSRRSPWPVIAGFAIFGLLGGVATARDELTSAPGSFAVAALAAVIGAATTLALLRAAAKPTDSAMPASGVVMPGTPLSKATNRRRMLAYGGAATGAVALAGVGRIGRTSAAERAREQLIAESAATTVPNAAETTTTTAAPSASFDNIEGITSYITPISPEDEFYLIDTALVKPQVDPATWSLTIEGPHVTTPVTYTYDELLARDMVTKEVTLSCVSNPVGGNLVGNAVWTGIPLTELLDEAGLIDPTNDQTQIFTRSVDGFTCGFPVPLAYDGRTAMLALKMNGEPLPIAHGFPARLVIAGLYGYVSATKWIDRIAITDWIGVDGYWMPRGWSKEGPVKTQSRIDVPRQGETVSAGPTTIAGIAWSPTLGIDKVEISIGDDDVWQEAELAVVESNETWVQWKYDWDAPAGQHVVRVRATDGTGFTQSPLPVAPAPNGAEGYHTITVRVA